MIEKQTELVGACACGEVRYRLASDPLFVHCCHCTCCQRETGSGYALNAMIEGNRVEILSGVTIPCPVPTKSGNPHVIHRCPTCHVALWSEYSRGDKLRFVRVGTLDEPSRCPPDIHIYTSTKLSWIPIPQGALSVPEFYDMSATWPTESFDRLKAHMSATD